MNIMASWELRPCRATTSEQYVPLIYFIHSQRSRLHVQQVTPVRTEGRDDDMRSVIVSLLVESCT